MTTSPGVDPSPSVGRLDPGQLERLATARLHAAAAEYINRGSGDNVTAAANRAAWRRLHLYPHVLHDVSNVSTATRVLDVDVATPVLVAPTAMQQLAHPDGELATARAAARSSTLMVASMVASRSLEDIAAAAPGAPRWAQLYLLRDRNRTRALAERARDAGYRAIVASVDGAAVPYGDHRDATPSPPELQLPNLTPGTDVEPDLLGTLSDFDAAVTVEDLALFHEWSGLPVVVKGVMRGDDARACVDAGAAAVIVSNHGGRIVDGCVATAAVLAEVVDAVDGRGEVYVDGGIRDATDVLKAVALGARAVLVGRMVVWGLAIDGEDGVAAVLDRITRDFTRVLAFCGAASPDQVTRDLIRAAPAP